MIYSKEIERLYDRWRKGEATINETEQLFRLLSGDGGEQHVELIRQGWAKTEPRSPLTEARKQQFADYILKNYPAANSPMQSPVHRIHFLKTTWFRYAAAIILVFGLGTVAYLWTTNKKAEQTLASDNNRLQNVIRPGGEKAVLTLGDGRKIILDEAANGQLANQGGVQVVKLANGQIVYDVKGLTDKDVIWNTMSTPVGGQYRVTLPDGTRVWLNAASSITYPAAFVSSKRQVKITGEVYFEVAKNKAKPFLVDIDGKSLIEVLGTSFNVNSYQDEGSIKATLLEGSIKFSGGATTAVATSSDRQLKSPRIGDLKSIVLKPGQQASTQIDGLGQIQVINNIDIEKALAWKNGLFNFNGSDLRSVMRQLERWYDIKVQYERSVSNDVFKGEMYRNVNLSTVLRALQKMGVDYRLDGKTVIVL